MAVDRGERGVTVAFECVLQTMMNHVHSARARQKLCHLCHDVHFPALRRRAGRNDCLTTGAGLSG